MGIFSGTPWDAPFPCDRCQRLASECACPPLPTPPVSYLPPERQTARVAQERRKKGKSVTVIRGLRAQESDLAALLKLLKTACGAGGTLNEETLEIQGDQVHRIENWLREKGYRVRS